MSQLRHPNVAIFMGACVDEGQVAVVMEYCARGSLYDVLHADVELSPHRTHRIALGSARGLLFLHSASPPILHRDVKSLNILLDEGWTPKLTDFGMSRSMAPHDDVASHNTGGSRLTINTQALSSVSSRRNTDATTHYGDPATMTVDVGTALWSPPEILELRGAVQRATYTEAVDVYAFGIVMFEIWSRQIPFPDLKHSSQVRKAVLAGQRPAIPLSMPAAVASITQKCWAQDFRDRPLMSEVVRVLEDSSSTTTGSVTHLSLGIIESGGTLTDSAVEMLRSSGPEPPSEQHRLSSQTSGS